MEILNSANSKLKNNKINWAIRILISLKSLLTVKALFFLLFTKLSTSSQDASAIGILDISKIPMVVINSSTSCNPIGPLGACPPQDICLRSDSNDDCGQIDRCNITDAGSCSVDDWCGHDHANCPSSDSCSFDYNSNCGQYDVCWTDNSTCGNSDNCVTDNSACPESDHCSQTDSSSCNGNQDNCWGAIDAGGCGTYDGCNEDNSTCPSHDICSLDNNGDCANLDVCATDNAGCTSGNDDCDIDNSPNAISGILGQFRVSAVVDLQHNIPGLSINRPGISGSDQAFKNLN